MVKSKSKSKSIATADRAYDFSSMTSGWCLRCNALVQSFLCIFYTTRYLKRKVTTIYIYKYVFMTHA